MTTRVLIGLASALSAPEVAWSLIDGGFQVVAFDPDPRRCALRHEPLVDLVTVTDPSLDAARAVADVEGLLCELAPAATLALDDRSLWVLGAADHGPTTRTAPVAPTLDIAFDKAEQLRLARRAGLQVPATTVVRGEQTGSLDLPGPGPWVVKPAEALALQSGRLVKEPLTYCDDEGAVRRAVDRLEGPALVQEVLTGVGVGVFGLAGPGGVEGWSGHERIRMMPPAGSGASAARAMDPTAELRASVERFLAAAGWTGLFMVELLRTDDGSHVFMELNGRCWGSMALARRRGLEYPAWAVGRALGVPVEVHEPEPDDLVVRHAGREAVHAMRAIARSPQPRPPAWPTRAQALRALTGWGGRSALYNRRPGRARLWAADTWATVASAVGPARSRSTLSAAVHVHSRWSYDASWELVALRRAFERRGYAAVLLCEHDRGYDQARFDEYRAACAAASSDRCVLLPGIEYSDPDNAVHVPVWGTERFLGEGRSTAETVAAAREVGAVAILAHPGRRDAVSRWEPSWADGLVGIEVWNHKYDGMAPDRQAVDLAAGTGLVPFASLDFHRRRQFSPLRMRVAAASTAPEDVVAALRAGRVAGAYGPVPLARLTTGPGSRVLDVVESARRPVARTARRGLARIRAARRQRARQRRVDDR